MAKKAAKKVVRKAVKKAAKKVVGKAAGTTARKPAARRKAAPGAAKKVVRTAPARKAANKARPAKSSRKTESSSARGSRRVVQKKAASRRSTAEARTPARRKGVRKATIASAGRDVSPVRRLGRSRIPIDAPLDLVFQNDIQAREAFVFLGIHSIRELEDFTADELVQRLTSPAKLTVGRIRKILAMNNRCLTDDEEFAVEFQELLSRPRFEG